MLIVVSGPPTAGKSTWIQAHAKPVDIVIDLDRIALALAGPGADDHDHDDVLLKVAHKARFAAIREAEQLRDQRDIYLIHTMPSSKARAKYRRLNARMVTVDPGQAVVIQRVRALRQPGMERVASRWYAQHARSPAHRVKEQRSRSW